MDLFYSLGMEIGDLVRQYGYPVIALLALLEGIGIPTPSGVVLALLGALAASGKLSALGVLAVFIPFNVLGNILFYVLGNSWRQRLVAWIEHHIRNTILQEANRLFLRYHIGAVFLCQMLARTIRVPIMAASIASGIRPLTFAILTGTGTGLWAIFWVYSGKLIYRLKRIINWADGSTIDDIIIVVVVVTALVLALYFKRGRSSEENPR